MCVLDRVLREQMFKVVLYKFRTLRHLYDNQTVDDIVVYYTRIHERDDGNCETDCPSCIVLYKLAK